MQPPIYDPEAVRPMWEELENVGFRSLTVPEEVDDALTRPGTTLLVINSICGCSAGGARPGVALALQHTTIPDQLVTVFAGVHRDAVDRAREAMPQVAPSSPFIALFRDGRLIYYLERRDIEGMDPRTIAANLARAFEQYCAAQGPSVPPEVFEQAIGPIRCGSSIPLFRMS